MSRVRLSAALIAALGLSLAACGGSEPAPDTAEAPAPDVPAPVSAPPAMMPDDAPPQEEAPADAAPADCRTEIGEAASARLVERCIAVSPATRPPCNALNPCEMIQGEIDRACDQYAPAEDKPAECAA